MSPRAATFVALTAFALLLLLAAVGYGVAVVPAVTLTLIETGVVAAMVLTTKKETIIPSSARDFVTGAVWLIVIFGLMLGLDCGLALLGEPNAPFLENCMRHSGVGFTITAFVFAIVFGAYVVYLFRAIALRVGGHGG